MTAHDYWQVRELKATAKACLANYRASHAHTYLLRAIEYTRLALSMLKGTR